jgi:nucleoside-diphosphate-sugar epimerase
MESVFGSYKDIQRRIPDLSKAKRLLGYEPKYSLKQAVEFMVNEVKKVSA